MERFTTLTAVAAPIDAANVDTDQLAPARFLRRPRRDGYRDVLFHDLRFTDQEGERPDFILNRDPFRKARILIADRNFGGGSSREQAVWSLVDYGIRCVMAESFGDIFYNNAVNHGLLLVRQSSEDLRHMRAALNRRPGTEISVDLEAQKIIGPEGETRSFSIEAGHRKRLLLGVDAIGLTLSHEADFAAFEGRYRARLPWIAHA
jgi:3-isopropylmalate/(R)-2-methylmalate dehydratase small subunit